MVCLYVEVTGFIVNVVCRLLFIGLGRMANKEYREFLICLINAQHTKGSFKHHDVCTVRMCGSNAYSTFTVCRLYSQVLTSMTLRCLIILSPSVTLMPQSSNPYIHRVMLFLYSLYMHIQIPREYSNIQ